MAFVDAMRVPRCNKTVSEYACFRTRAALVGLAVPWGYFWTRNVPFGYAAAVSPATNRSGGSKFICTGS